MKYSLTIKELEIILDIVNTKSLSQTARNTGIAQANISRMIINIERKYSLDIFERSGRAIHLTPFGEELIPFIKNHISSYIDMTSFIENYKTKLAGFVRLQVPIGISHFVSKYIIPEVMKKHPEIKIDVYTNNLRKEDYTKGVQLDNKCDIMFTYALPQDDSLIAFKLIETRCNIYCTRSFLENNPIESIFDYSHHCCILYHSFMHGIDNLWNIQHIVNSQSIQLQVKGNIICDNLYTAVDLAMSDLGFIYAPDFMVTELNLQNKLIPTIPIGYAGSMFTYIIYKKRKHQPYRVSIVIDTIIKIFNSIIQKSNVLIS